MTGFNLSVNMELCKVLAEHPSLAVMPDAKKVRCSLTGHEMPAKVQDILAYVNGHKYQRLRSVADYDYSTVEPYLVQSERRSQQLYCRLTGRYINKLPDHVERHRKGKRFTSALERYKKGETVLVDEIQAQERGEDNHGITSDDQYGRIRVTSAGVGTEGRQVNKEDGSEWREGVEMEDDQWIPTEEDDGEWIQDMVDGRSEDRDGSDGRCSDKYGDKGEDSDSHGSKNGEKGESETLSSGERKRNRSALDGGLLGAQAMAKKKKQRKKLSRNFISRREKLLNF